MADNFVTNPAAGGDTFAADDIAGVKWQRVKIGHGADGSATDVSSASPLPVDTELPAAAALSDATANPTAPMVGAAGMVYDAAATVWKRQVQAKPTWDLHTYNGVAAGVQLLAQDDTYLRPQKIAASVADGDTGTYHGVTSPRLYNGASFDRQRGNTEGTLLASAARTASTASATQTNYNGRGVRIYVSVSAKAAATTLDVYITSQATWGHVYITSVASGWTAAANKALVVDVCPGITPATMTAGVGGATDRYSAFAQQVPRSWGIFIGHGDANSITYSVEYALGI